MTGTPTMDQLQALSEPELRRLLRNGRTREQREAAREALAALHAIRRQIILGEFTRATVAFVTYADQLQGVIDAIEVAPPGGSTLRTLNGLLETTAAVYATLRDPERLASATEETEATIVLPVRDEEAEPPMAIAGGARSGGTTGAEIRLPPVNSRDYPELRDEYVAYFEAVHLRPESAGNLNFYVSKLQQHRARYQEVGDPLGIPWYFIGCIHALESGFNFNTHLFNGDPLTGRTVRVPKGQPEAPPANGGAYTWEESARAAMALKGYDEATDWSLPRLLYRWEAYNGFGYRPRAVPTPYLWSFSTLYSRGRYVADHKFDPNAVSKQAGAATMLRKLVEDNTVAPPT